DLVPGLDVQRDLLALVGDLAVAHGDDLALLGLFLRRVGNDDPALFDFLLLEPLHQQAIVQRTNLHRPAPSFDFGIRPTSPRAVQPRHPASTRLLSGSLLTPMRPCTRW